MIIINSTIKDIDEIFRLYKIATEYQRAKKTVVVWPEFERQLVETEIAENRQWKLFPWPSPARNSRETDLRPLVKGRSGDCWRDYS